MPRLPPTHRPAPTHLAPIVLLLVLGLLAPGPARAQSKELGGWASGDQWEKAVEHAQEEGKPIVVIKHIFGKSDKADKVTQAWASHRGLRGMVPVHFKSTAQSKRFKEAADRANDDYDYGPKLYLFDPQLRLIGYRNYRHRHRIKPALAVAGEILKWQDRAQRDLARADQLAETGRIGAALKTVDEVLEQDIKSTYAVQLLTVSAEEGQTPKRPDPPKAGWFYPDLAKTKREQYAELAEQRLEEARRLYQDLKYREALAELRPLAADTSDLPQVEQAKALREQITESMKSQ